MERLIVVSGDSHAVPPPELWPTYLEAEYHDLLPEMHADNERYQQLLGLFANFSPQVLEVIDAEGVWASGGTGRLGWRRAARRDGPRGDRGRDGVPGRSARPHPAQPPVPPVPAGRRRRRGAGRSPVGGGRVRRGADRILVVGDPASGTDLDAMVAELEWIADHGFAGAYLPGDFARPDLPLPYDALFDPYWSRCEDLGLAVVVHAGYG